MIIKENTQFNNQVSENIEKIRELFPNTVTESEKGLMVDFDKLKEELSSDLMDSKEERYQMTWPGKKASLKIANESTDKTLIPDRESSVDFDNTQNIYIEGDNLEALKLLEKPYKSKIKFIYIDPPYNTGKDFVYKDDFAVLPKDYLLNVGIKNEEGETLTTNKETSGRYHSSWLTMMYPRLKIARELLSEDGVIFISIDDNEQANLKKICDEIFGEDNFVAQIIIDGTPKNDPYIVATSHEYCLVYCSNFISAKNSSFGIGNPFYGSIQNIFDSYSPDYKKIENELKNFYQLNNLSNDNIANYKYADEDGVFRTGPIDDPQSSGPTDQRINPVTGNYCKTPVSGWRCTLETWEEWVEDNLIFFPDNDETLPSKKTYISSERLDVLKSYKKIQTKKDTNYLKNIFNTKISIFSNPKPIDLIKDFILNLNTKDAVVLDFFSGSGTFADAVLRVNSEKNSNIKFILVQIPEVISEEGKKSNKEKKVAKEAINFLSSIGKKNLITELAKERIRRAGKKIKEETKADIDYGFKVFKVSDSVLNPSAEISPNTLTQGALNFENIKESISNEDLLYFSILKTGRPLDSKVIKESIGKNEFFTVLDSEENNIIVACFDKEIEFNDEIIKMIADKNPLRVYFRDSSFKTDNDKINFEQKLKELSSESIEIYVL